LVLESRNASLFATLLGALLRAATLGAAGVDDAVIDAVDSPDPQAHTPRPFRAKTMAKAIFIVKSELLGYGTGA
jgi:hypothetical protein